MEVDYPLDDEYVFDVEAPSSRGFTRASLAQAVADLYAHIYAREEATSTVATGKVPGLLNRNATTGDYGISGHDLEDLALQCVEYDAERGLWTLGVDS
mmetsp:Transcript_9901/g.29749  ORF Transcript_9901/g.29749 Transcript_9901/m.29749 type:complete len:98 (-) Transcript_9901:671-964(-)